MLLEGWRGLVALAEVGYLAKCRHDAGIEESRDE